jgi:hypothetical protein
LKSSFKIIDPDGKPILYDNIEDGQHSWDLVPLGSKIEWEVDTDGHSDRIHLKLSYWDMELFLAKMNEEILDLSEEDSVRYENGDKVIMDEVLVSTLRAAGGMENLMKDIWSDVKTTGSDGKLSGIIDLNPSWPKTIYFFNAHYGYRGDTEETSNFEKSVWVGIDVAGWVLVAVASALTFGGAAILAGVASAASTALLVVEMGKMGNKIFGIGYGPATENKYGESFPMLGFNHTYTFFYDVPAEDEGQNALEKWQELMDDKSLTMMEKANLMVQFYGLVKTTAVISMLVILYYKYKTKKRD